MGIYRRNKGWNGWFFYRKQKILIKEVTFELSLDKGLVKYTERHFKQREYNENLRVVTYCDTF